MFKNLTTTFYVDNLSAIKEKNNISSATYSIGGSADRSSDEILEKNNI